ncbi:hypothetical protein scyTo_0001683 [Scyliorhinus torazame]|uniref:DUF3456 domain-containing protein n=1 Tax=Scyliorhinus torazame TaxID=75743 RepID=A0A401PF54_SCYTO|nr:hypothetical protein [Scyliorhinus torazame]
MNFLVAAVLTVCLCDGASGVGQKGRPGEYASQSSGQFQESGTIEMKSPNLNDEEFHSSHMPDYLKCDSCRAISYQMQEYLSKWESKNSAVKEGKTILNESDYTDALEKCCSQSWEKHGVIQLDGVKRLSGPGLETEDFTGVMMTSGPWPARSCCIWTWTASLI